MFKNALVSVSDKTGLAEFILPLFKSGMRVVSTGGTAKHLQEHGVDVVDISEQTGFPEVMDGRVKTLHPNVHMCLLARLQNSEDQKILKDNNLQNFDLVVGNLYPFSKALEKELPFNEQIEFIDIGGPSFLRSAAKNTEKIATICNPEDYKWVLEKNELTNSDRVYLASKVFSHTSSYDGIISDYLMKDLGDNYKISALNISGDKIAELRYGENPQQKGVWYKSSASSHGLHRAEILQGKALSFNNLLDLEAAVNTLRRFPDQNAVISVKHNNPCGVAIGSDLFESLTKSLAADPMSVFGGIIAVDGKVTLPMAEKLTSMFLECVVAQDYTTDAIAAFKKKKNFRVLKWPDLMSESVDKDIRSITGGFLVQDKDPISDNFSTWQFPYGKPDDDIKSDLELAWRVCAQLKSNAISIVGKGQTLGLGMGQVNRVDAVKLAIARANQFHPEIKSRVMASDAFFPFSDSIELAHEAGIKWVIQPGGSIKDNDVLSRAESLGVKIILTGVRHFLH